MLNTITPSIWPLSVAACDHVFRQHRAEDPEEIPGLAARRPPPPFPTPRRSPRRRFARRPRGSARSAAPSDKPRADRVHQQQAPAGSPANCCPRKIPPSSSPRRPKPFTPCRLAIPEITEVTISGTMIIFSARMNRSPTNPQQPEHASHEAIDLRIRSPALAAIDCGKPTPSGWPESGPRVSASGLRGVSCRKTKGIPRRKSRTNRHFTANNSSVRQSLATREFLANSADFPVDTQKPAP